MKAKELKARLMAAAELGIKKHFLEAEQASGELLLGGVTMFSPSRFKIRVVDARYTTHTYTIILEEGAP